ncbi:uncharacterized protein LOC134004691 isoform X1 [Scomber scombrus]|uniref:uncharacterized protein LOC134004691 isoform X1 n=1 Tax=Scomber scombrus TaxID=13677 RepID=UPI002DDB8018|nr:uncharacterized protein LOC134004691 isoform X1 [Scomber scombrus]
MIATHAMQSGCPHSQGGAHPEFQKWSNTGARKSPHLTNEKPNIMVAVPDSTEPGVDYGPPRWQQGCAPSLQNFPYLHGQQGSHANIENTGFQQVVPRKSACTQICDGQINRKVKHFHSSAHVSAQLQQRNDAFFASRSSAVPQGYSLGVPTSPSQQCSLVSQRKKQNSFPMLRALLGANHTDPNSFSTTPSSEKSNSNTELNTAHLSNEKHCKSQHARSSLAVLNRRQARTQNPDQFKETCPTLHQQQGCSPPLSGPPRCKFLPVGQTEPPTDDQIMEHILEKLKYYRTLKDSKRLPLSNKRGTFSTNEQDSRLQSGCVMPMSNSVGLLSTVSDKDVEKQSPNCVVEEQCAAAVGQKLEEDCSKDNKAMADSTPKSKEMGDCTTLTSENNSTGTLLSAIKSSKNSPKSDFVKKSASVTCDLPVKKHLDVTSTAYGDVRLVYSDGCSEDKTFVSSNDDSFYSKWWCDKSSQKVTTIHYTLTALKELITSLANVETIAEMDNFSEVILQQYWNGDKDNIHLFASTEYPHIMMNVAATCTKNEGESPVVLTAVSGIPLNEPTERHPSSKVNCSSSQKEGKSACLNINKNVDDIDQEPDVFGALKCMTVKEREFTGQKPMETIWLDSVQSVSEDPTLVSGSVVSENKTNKTLEFTSPNDNHDANTKKQKSIEDSQNCSVTSKDVIALSKPNSLIDQIHPTQQSEDVSDYDVSRLSIELPKNEHEELNVPTCFKHPQYEDISEDEKSQVQNPSLAQVPEPNDKQSIFENEGYKQSQAHMKTEIISSKTPIPKKHVSPKTAVLADSEGLLARQPKHSVSYSPFNASTCEDQTEGQDEDQDEDDDGDDDWLVIPISMSDLTFGPKDEDQNGPEEVVLNNGINGDNGRQGGTSPTHTVLHCPAPKPGPASTLSQLEVFDTIESFQQAKAVRVRDCFEVAPGRSTAEHEQDSGGEPHTSRRKRESYSDSEDSSTTEDSCDYSSGSEQNYLTVSKRLLERSAPLPPVRFHCVSEKESNSDEVTITQKSQTSSSVKSDCMENLRQLITARVYSKHVQPTTNTQRMSKKESIITLDSDTEDDCYQNCNKRKKRKRLFTGSRSVNSGDTLCSQQRRDSPEIEECEAVKESLKKSRSSADSPAPQHRSKMNKSQVKDVIEDAFPGQSHITEKSGQLIEANSVITLSSDTVDSENEHNNKKAKRKRLHLPGSADSGDATSVQQYRHAHESVDTLWGTASEPLQEPRLSPAETIRQKNSKKETKVFHGSERVAKNDICKKKVKKYNVNDLFATQSGPETVDQQSYESSPEKQPRSVDEEEDSRLVPNPGLVRLFIQPSSPASKCLKLVKESRVHHKKKYEARVSKTPTETSKKNDSCDTKTQGLYRNRKENERHHETKNEGQGIVTKPKVVSRQLSLPNQERPSTSTSRLSSTSGHLSEARRSSASRGSSQSEAMSASSAPPKSKQSLPIPRHLPSSKIQRSHSYSCPSTSAKSPPSSASTYSSAKKARQQVTEDWNNGFFPTRRDRKHSMRIEDNSRTTNHDCQREARPGPTPYERAPRQGHRYHNPQKALMKKSICEATEWMKHIHRKTPMEPRRVHEGYKWSEKPTKGSARRQRCRYSPRPH